MGPTCTTAFWQAYPQVCGAVGLVFFSFLCRFVGVHSKVVLGPLAKAGIAPSVSTVNRAIKASEVPISYGYDPARLDMVMTSAVETINPLMRTLGLVDGSVLCVASTDEVAISGEYPPPPLAVSLCRRSCQVVCVFPPGRSA